MLLVPFCETMSPVAVIFPLNSLKGAFTTSLVDAVIVITPFSILIVSPAWLYIITLPEDISFILCSCSVASVIFSSDTLNINALEFKGGVELKPKVPILFVSYKPLKEFTCISCNLLSSLFIFVIFPSLKIFYIVFTNSFIIYTIPYLLIQV